MNMENFKKWVCKAIEMEEKGKKFYEKAAADCDQGLGKEIFSMLRDDELKHIERIKEIEKALNQNQGLANACALPDDHQDPGNIFRKIAARSQVHKACPSTVKALKTGIDFELALVKFYEDALEKAQDNLEKQFLKHMVAEEKGHYDLLEDLSFYYEDPEGWAIEQDKAGLDGA
ncbi:MAG: hypothetical protein D5R98_10225 [Desulfonatronovibrio sp. MSAO_Bac4]|nr:MAG: hypothetical protein D5R98_10225 [Desulfonatronovibrio sp. MSAO_Bac4]